MARDTRSRKWQLTINNPEEHEMSHEQIKEALLKLSTVKYWCMCDETGEQGTYHTHLFIYSPDAIRFSTLKNVFPMAHFEMAKGTVQQNRDYIRKEGKWAADRKKETNHPETFEEWGEIPIERQGARNDLADLYDMIRSGADDADILESSPQYMMNLAAIGQARQVIREKDFRNKFRELTVTYISGPPGVGKTRGVMEHYGFDKCYRVTDYSHPFDGYRGQDVIIFEEFRSSLKVQDMLNYLDGYPLELPARFSNKTACYTKVYIISNLNFKAQYNAVMFDAPDTYAAWVRRVHNVVEYDRSGNSEEFTMEEWRNEIRRSERELEGYIPGTKRKDPFLPKEKEPTLYDVAAERH